MDKLGSKSLFYCSDGACGLIVLERMSYEAMMANKPAIQTLQLMSLFVLRCCFAFAVKVVG